MVTRQAGRGGAVIGKHHHDPGLLPRLASRYGCPHPCCDIVTDDLHPKTDDRTDGEPPPVPKIRSEEAALLEAARRGDRRALEALLAFEAPRIYRFGRQMCGHTHDAEDVLQETLLAAARGIGEFRGASSVSTWLYTIARSYCIKKRRRSKFAPAHEESLEDGPTETRSLPDAAPDPEQAMATHELGAALGRAIDELDPASREVLVLRDAEGLSAKEVAEVMGISVDAVKSRLHRARSAVRERMVSFVGRGEAAASARGDCPDVVDLFSRHLEGEISADACVAMEAHLASCPRCRSACESLQDTLALCRRHAGPEVPAAVQATVRRALHEFLRLP